MPSSEFGREEISGIIENYLDHVGSEKGELSRMEVIETVADDMSRRFDGYLGSKTPRGLDSRYKRESDYAFMAASAELMLGDEELTPVEQRIKRSDHLTLHYAIAGGGIDDMVRAYIEQLPSEEQAELENDEDRFREKLVRVGAEIGAKFVAKQRRKNKEDLLVERYPEAPTTGFEFEYLDPFRSLVYQTYQEPRRIEILQALRDGDKEKLKECLKTGADSRFLFQAEQRALSAVTEDDPDGYQLWIDAEILYRKKRIGLLEEFRKTAQKVGIQEQPEQGLRANLQSFGAAGLERQIEKVKEVTQSLSDNEAVADVAAEATATLQRQLDLVVGKLELEKGEALTIPDINTIRMLVPSPAYRLSIIAPFEAKNELDELEEVITSPSVSVRMQLREFLYAAKLGAFSEELSVHQNVAGIELAPERTDYMEVTALLEAADYNHQSDEIPDTALEKIENGENAYTDPFKKVSKCHDGGMYYFPYHRVKEVAGIVAYPQQVRTLVETRSKRAFDPEISFAAHVRASTFTWLAAWGEQAANINEVERNTEQQQLAGAWETLMTDWKDVLKQKGIKQPQGADRYQEVELEYPQGSETGLPKINYIGEERYSLYVEQISAKRTREKQRGIENNPDSIKQQARQLIIDYQRKVKKVIGY